MTHRVPAHGVAPRWRNLFFLLGVFHLFQYTAIHDRLGLASLRLMFVIAVILGIALLTTVGRGDLSDTQTRAWMVLLGLMCFHVGFARNNMAAFGAVKTVIPYFIAYLAFLKFATTPGRVMTLVWIWVFAYAYLASHAAWSGGKGISGYLGDENDVALALNMGVPLVYFLAAGTRSAPRKLLLWSVLGVMIAALIATRSRGGFIGFLAVLCFLILASKHRVRGFIGAVAIFGGLVTFAPESYMERMGTIAEYEDVGTAQDRIYMWKRGWEMFTDHPILGIGGYNFVYAVAPYVPEEVRIGKYRGGMVAHSLYFTLLPEFGLIGTFLFGTIVWATFRDLRRVSRRRRTDSAGLGTDGRSPPPTRAADMTSCVAMGLAGGLIGFLVSAVFVSVLYYPHFWSLVALSGALRRSAETSVVQASPLRRSAIAASGTARGAVRSPV